MEPSGQAPQIIEDLHGDVTELVHLGFRLLERSQNLFHSLGIWSDS